MKKVGISVITLAMTLTIFSCQKEDVSPTPLKGSGTPDLPQSNQKIVQNCFYTPFQQTGSNQWTVNFEGVNCVFSNLHVRTDGRLYGRLLSAGNNSVILTGGDSYNQRDFAFQVPTCSIGSQSIETVSVVHTSVTQPANVTQATLNTALANAGIFDLLNQYDEVEVTVTTMPTTTTNATIVRKYKNYQVMSCAGSKLALGKLVAKGVVVNLTTNAVTFTELGVATMCFADPMVTYVF